MPRESLVDDPRLQEHLQQIDRKFDRLIHRGRQSEIVADRH